MMSSTSPLLADRSGCPDARHRRSAVSGASTPLSALLRAGSRRARLVAPLGAANPSILQDALVSVSGQFALAAPAGLVSHDQPSRAGQRPWGLRRMGPIHRVVDAVPARRYDPVLQCGVNLADSSKGPPTAPTTGTVDGEDPPSSEDYNNDFCPDAPFTP